MNERIRQVIAYATHGNEARFAESVGWSRQYLCNVLSGRRGIGITPIQKILRAYPDISARWLVLGEGAMLVPASLALADCLYAILRTERNAGDAEDLRRAARAIERVTAPFRGKNKTETAP